ncbi:MAG: hypothetical protein ABJ360_23840 [Roseobacter sp.]
MTDNDYLDELPKNILLAANKICTDYFSGDLKENPKDVSHILCVLLGDELQPGWDDELKEDDSANVGFFSKSQSQMKIDNRIALIHRNVKALTAKATVDNPALVNIFLVELNEGEKKKIEETLFSARALLREVKAKDADAMKAFQKNLEIFQKEADRRHSDFRVFLDGIVDAMETTVAAGPDLKPIFDQLKISFDVVDKTRKDKETQEVARPLRALPAPARAKPK